MRYGYYVVFLLGWLTTSVYATPHLARPHDPSQIKPGKTLSIASLKPFFNYNEVVQAKELEQYPYIVGEVDEHLVAGARAGDQVYVRGLKASAPGTYTIYRRGNPYIDPVSHKTLGYAAINIGEASLVQSGDPAIMQLTKVYREALIGDRVTTGLAQPNSDNFTAHKPTIPISAQIIAFFDNLNQSSTWQAVVLNQGSNKGLQPGDILGIFRHGQTMMDKVTPDENTRIKLPDLPVGELMVFRTFKHVSFALITKATAPIRAKDIVKNI